MYAHGSDWREELDHQRREARRRYLEHVCSTLASQDMSEIAPDERVDLIFDALFVAPRRDGSGACARSCHPQLP